MPESSTITVVAIVLGAIVSVFSIITTILGVGWKLGQIVLGIRTEIVEFKGEMRGLNGVNIERISQLERRMDAIEKVKNNAAPCRRKASK